MTLRRWTVSLCVLVAFVGLTILGCATQPPSGLNGDPAAGETKVNQSCAGCHTARSLQGSEDRIGTNLGLVSPAMIGITLTDQQVADLQAYIFTL
jgi:mono/diheme cytochrome c family protein